MSTKWNIIFKCTCFLKNNWYNGIDINPLKALPTQGFYDFFYNFTNVVARIHNGKNEVWCGFVKTEKVLVGEDYREWQWWYWRTTATTKGEGGGEGRRSRSTGKTWSNRNLLIFFDILIWNFHETLVWFEYI